MRKFYGLVFFRVVFLDFGRSTLFFLPPKYPPDYSWNDRITLHLYKNVFSLPEAGRSNFSGSRPQMFSKMFLLPFEEAAHSVLALK